MVPTLRLAPPFLGLALACAAPTPEPVSQCELPAELARTRVIAEWEPAVGTLIAWPFALPDPLVVDLAAAGELYVLVPEAELEEAGGKLADLGIEGEGLHLIPSDVGSPWTRDWGPHQVFTAEGEWAIVDPLFEGYPWMPREPDGGEGNTWNPRGADDVAPADFAAYMEAPRIELPHYLTGGNFLVDGRRRAFSTEAMIRENGGPEAEAEFRAALAAVTGVDDLIVVANTEELGIQHIDCWFKPLDEETLLVKRAPEDHPEARWIEENLALLEALETPYGRPYRILRIDCPRFDEDAIAAYTNSLILGDKVFVPLFGIPGDAEALATFEQALPGYEVRGYEHSGERRGWQGFDALHCRTRAVFDGHMLSLRHPVLRGPLAPGVPHRVNARIVDHSGAGLVAEELRLSWRLRGERAWRSAPLEARGPSGDYKASLPAQESGAVFEYFLGAADAGGRRATLPASAPQGFYSAAVE